MLRLNQLFRFYINASIHVALAVVALYLVRVQYLNILPNSSLVGFLFFSTIVCYNFVKYGVEAEKYLIVAKPAHRPIQYFSFLSFLGCVYFLFQLPFRLWIVIGISTLVSALYALPFLPSSKNLRSLSGLKIFLVAGVWTLFTVVLPTVEYQLGLSKQVILVGLQNFVLVLILILPFEIRDLKYDKPELKTLPQRWGVQGTKQFGYVLVLVFLVVVVLLGDKSWETMVSNGVVAIFLMMVLYRTNETQNAYFSSFWVEAVPILMLFLNWILRQVIA